jgi:hypothetical protein
MAGVRTRRRREVCTLECRIKSFSSSSSSRDEAFLEMTPTNSSIYIDDEKREKVEFLNPYAIRPIISEKEPL